LRAAGEQVGKAQHRGYVQRLHGQEAIEHPQHLGRGW